jgi:hypothetical protein
MANVVNHQATRERMRTELEKLVGELDASVPTGFTQAKKSFLTAMDYDDVALMKSHLNTAMESLVEVTNEAVQRRLGWPQRIEDPCKRLQEFAEQADPGEFDDLGRDIESRFDKMIQILTDLREGSVQLLLKHGYEVESVEQLESDIEAMRGLKEQTLGGWPWSADALPALDQKMLAESKAAWAQGEKGIPVDELIRQIRGETTKG